jgi:hypothetical protein
MFSVISVRKENAETPKWLLTQESKLYMPDQVDLACVAGSSITFCHYLGFSQLEVLQLERDPPETSGMIGLIN